MVKYYKWFIGFGILLRLVLSVVTYHSDLGAFAQAGRSIAGNGQWLSFYDTMLKPKVDTVFNYQPLAYLIPSVFYLPFKSVVLETGDYIKDRTWIMEHSSAVNPLLLLYKYPMILADLAIIWLIAKFFTERNKKILAMVLWSLNPIAIFVSSVMGQVDIVIALFIVLGLYFYKKDYPFWSVSLIAASALIKPVGLILIPLIALHHFSITKKIGKSTFIGLLGIGIYLLGIIPYLGSVAYRQYALFAEQIGKSTYASISIASGHDIPLFFIALTLITILIWHQKISLPAGIASALLSSLVFSHFHPQWLVWVMPWIIIRSVTKGDYFVYLIALASWMVILFSFDSTLHLQTFLHSNLSLSGGFVSSSYFLEIIQISRACLIAILIWCLADRYEEN